jgi:hypothetical protein
MKSKPTLNPKVIHFGVVSHGNSMRDVELRAYSDADMTARIEGGSSKFSIVDIVCQLVREVRLSDDEISQLPPDLQKDSRYHFAQERVVIGNSDGIAPLSVKSGNEVVVTVKYHAVKHPGSVADSSELVIEGTNWETVSVPIHAAVGQVNAVQNDGSIDSLQTNR